MKLLHWVTSLGRPRARGVMRIQTTTASKQSLSDQGNSPSTSSSARTGHLGMASCMLTSHWSLLSSRSPRSLRRRLPQWPRHTEIISLAPHVCFASRSCQSSTLDRKSSLISDIICMYRKRHRQRPTGESIRRAQSLAIEVPATVGTPTMGGA